MTNTKQEILKKYSDHVKNTVLDYASKNNISDQDKQLIHDSFIDAFESLIDKFEKES